MTRTAAFYLIMVVLSPIHSFGQGVLVHDRQKDKVQVEAYVSDNEDKMIILVKIAGEDELKEVMDQQMPEGIEIVYNVFKNPQDNVIYVGEFPQSISGDWTLELHHYFSDDGRLVAFDKRLTYLNDECAHGGILEKQTELYDYNFKIVSASTTLTDVKGNKLEAKNCGHSYDWKFDRYARVSELLKAKGIEL